MKIKVSPSILACDFGHIADGVEKAQNCGADWVHVDVMDGHFVPNISIGPQTVAAVKKVSTIPLDVHLMISHPDKYIEAFAKAGADIITVHVEADHDMDKTLDLISSYGVKSGIVLNPDTDFEDYMLKWVEKIDMILVMSVYPGFGGQKFIPSALDKIKKIRKMTQDIKPELDIQVDGGVNLENAPTAINAGANVLVAGTALFNSADMAGDITALQAMGN